MAAQFLDAVRSLDYPPVKLDVKILLEHDDLETGKALRAARPPPFVEIVVAPHGAPRTKPRALNVALPLARGRLLAIFDAEDRPGPDQLRIAAENFTAAGPRVACLQARLAIDNGDEGFLPYFFAIGYATLFDVINPGLAALGLPLPLGGILRRIVGRDAWNVTEDAPTQFGNWIGQRSRWMKDWMQKLSVFLRTPRRHWRTIGAGRYVAALRAMSSLLAGPLFGPFYGLKLARNLIGGDLLAPPRRNASPSPASTSAWPYSGRWLSSCPPCSR